MEYSKEINAALRIMTKAHSGQTDKSGFPYVFHPLIVASSFKDEKYIATALLHDVLEDSEYTEADLLKEGISREVVNAVKLLTHDKDEPYGDYIAAIDRDPIARAVKIEDLKHNSNTFRFDGEVPPAVLKKINECYLPSLEKLQKDERLKQLFHAAYDNKESSIGSGSASFIVKDEEFRECDNSSFVKWLKSQGYSEWQYSRIYVPMPILYINMNEKLYSYARPGVLITSSVCLHAITKEEFKTIYDIYKKYDGLSAYQMPDDV